VRTTCLQRPISVRPGWQRICISVVQSCTSTSQYQIVCKTNKMHAAHKCTNMISKSKTKELSEDPRLIQIFQCCYPKLKKNWKTFPGFQNLLIATELPVNMLKLNLHINCELIWYLELCSVLPWTVIGEANLLYCDKVQTKTFYFLELFQNFSGARQCAQPVMQTCQISSTTRLFADDTILYQRISSAADTAEYWPSTRPWCFAKLEKYMEDGI